MHDDLNIRQMTRPEVDQLVDWAAAEGWNPGRHDADVFWANDPDAFVAAEMDGVVAGGGAITSYQGEYGFMGFFIVRPEYRGRGLGDRLWHARRDRLLARLQPGATIGMDGVFAMQSYYAKGGFVFSHRNLRYSLERATAAPSPASSTGDAALVPLHQLPLPQLLAYDLECFPAPRATFLQRWITLPDALALGHVTDGRLTGYGVIRRCRVGWKIGPLYANDGTIAAALYSGLTRHAGAGPVYLDVPENNADAMALAQRHGMREVFGCARMYLGPVPRVANERTYGVTTFELG